MGHPAAEASARRQSAFTHRDKHHATLQRASAPIGVTVYGHIGLLSVGGVVHDDAPNLNATNIAEHAYKLYRQPRGKWEREIEIHE
jgi:hypothetical protein